MPDVDGDHFKLVALSRSERGVVMELEIQGELVPIGGGDSIPLSRRVMTMGRRESCDICLRFPNVSGLHCELSWRDGYWFIRDLGSTNGIKINGVRILQRPLRPGDELAISNRRYTIQYNLASNGLEMLESQLSGDEDLRSQSLLEKAGLAKPKGKRDDD
jgi:pSer/pThr/pTyr-binding forkhead associated (FHA) protein